MTGKVRSKVRPPFAYPCWVAMEKDPKNFAGKSAFSQSGMLPPGHIYDMADNDMSSHVPCGGVIPFGRGVVTGVGGTVADEFNAGNNNFGGPGDTYYTNTDTISLPDAKGEWLTTEEGELYADAGLALPTDANGALCFEGISVWCPTKCKSAALDLPWGHKDIYYADILCDQVAVVRQGRVWVYTETDIDKKSQLYMRTCITDDTPGSLQLLGAFLDNDDGGNAQLVDCAGVFRPGCAGGAFVMDFSRKPSAGPAPVEAPAEGP